MKTAAQRTTQLAVRWIAAYTGHWWVDCYIWYSEEGTGWGLGGLRPHPVPSSLYQMYLTDQRPVYQINIIRCGNIIIIAL